MQAVWNYGRLVSRAVINGLYSSASSESVGAPAPPRSNPVKDSHHLTGGPRLVTAVAGFPKDLNLGSLRRGQFGDDSYFVVRHKLGDVIGESSFKSTRYFLPSFAPQNDPIDSENVILRKAFCVVSNRW
jgi:hypothetical protein